MMPSRIAQDPRNFTQLERWFFTARCFVVVIPNNRAALDDYFFLRKNPIGCGRVDRAIIFKGKARYAPFALSCSADVQRRRGNDQLLNP